MPELVPIKIRITKDAKGFFIYPKFKKELQFFKDNPDYHSLPIYYDKKADCQIDEDGSPFGMRWCMKLVPKEFAEEALVMYPNTVFEMTEAEAEEFYNTRVMGDATENKYDIPVLQGLQIELDLAEKLGHDATKIKVKIEKAIDPNDDEPGIKKIKGRRWKDLKKDMNLKVAKIKKS